MIAILAFGSLIDDPGPEIEPLIVKRLSARTPFAVEFARYSDKRGGGPTLVPVQEGGAQVDAKLLVLSQVSVQEAKGMLWRRETQQIGTGREYRQSETPPPNKVLIRELKEFQWLETVLYVDFPPDGKVSNPGVDDLADRAIASAENVEGDEDGITYLLRVRNSGVETPLMEAYEKKILEKTGTASLAEALERVRESS